MGHRPIQKQLEFQKTYWKFRYTHGGSLRKKRKGRKFRPLSTRDPIHLVFKADRKVLRRGFRLPLGFLIVNRILKRYSKHFYVKIEQQAVCQDHLHLLVRLTRRSQGLHFLRVVAGQIAQQFQKNGFYKVTDTPALTGAANGEEVKSHQVQGGGLALDHRTGPRDVVRALDHRAGLVLWKVRPFTRVIKGWKPYQIVKNYVRLNEKEARGEICYKPERLKGLSSAEWELLWS